MSLGKNHNIILQGRALPAQGEDYRVRKKRICSLLYQITNERVNNPEVFHRGDVIFPNKQGQAQAILDEKGTLNKCILLRENVSACTLTKTREQYLMI